MDEKVNDGFTLGIDLGSNSLGWALIRQENGEPKGLMRAGVRVFDAATEGDRESGDEESRNLKRRQMRLQRRQTWRRARRQKKVFDLLQQFGLLPAVAPVSSPAGGDGGIAAAKATARPEEQRQQLLNALDQAILASSWFAAKKSSGLYPEPEQTPPYMLRAAALDESLEPHFLGRALYHLAQRRGFLSNRLQTAKKDEDLGVVKQGISELRQKMADAGARTLGEYFSRLSPSEQRIRGRWTHRDMFKKEFDAIWDSQAKYHPGLLTEDRKKQLRQAIFYQRPLRFDPNVIGVCELEPDCRRAPAYLLVSQRFRLIQTVNNLKVLSPGEAERNLAPGERAKLIEALQLQGHLHFRKDRKSNGETVPSIRKLLGLPKGCAFNLERGGEKSLKGNRTFADFHAVFGQRWLDMPPQERDAAVEYVYAFEKPDKLKEAGKKRWSLDEAAAEKLAETSLEPDYMNLSRRAMEKVLPLLEQGLTYADARCELYPEKFQARGELASLPPVEAASDPAKLQEWLERARALPPGAQPPDPIPAVRNPAVMRSLSELRKVVNAIIRQHGKPAEIHIELARDLRKPKWQRQENSDRMRANEKARKAAAKRILDDTGIKEPSPEDIRRVLLAEECHWECPYTGKAISMRKLVGPESEFQIEHIIPFSRSLDNTFVNLTLCHVQENNIKADRTPYEAYCGDPERSKAILDRVKRFSGSRGMVAEKLRRFEMTPEEVEGMLGDFSERQLRDTAYASTLACKYLSLLYGGLSDTEHHRRVQATPGRATAFLRNEWGLNAILKDGSTDKGGTVPKERTDHRHHAVDAVAIALTSPGTVKQLSDAAQRAPIEHRRRFGSLQAPWPDFVDCVRDVIDSILVSHRVSKKVSGALHKETLYSAKGHAEVERRVRKPLSQLTKSEVEDIADEEVKRRVLEKLGDGDPKKVFSISGNLPFFETEDSRRIPIKRVRIKKAVPTFTLGGGKTARHVASESNHHLEIFAELDEDGNEVEWDGVVVSMAEAYRRKELGVPIVQREHGPHRNFKFSLAPGEAVQCDMKKADRQCLVVRSVTQLSAGRIVIGLAPANDARKKAEMQKSKDWVWKVPDTLRGLNPRKVVVGPLGEVTEAHD
jgi:CRISPR-associated endonuclease Csn1